MWMFSYSVKLKNDDEAETLAGYLARINGNIMDGDFNHMPELYAAWWEDAAGTRSNVSASGLEELNKALQNSWDDYCEQVASDGGRWVDGEVFYA